MTEHERKYRALIDQMGGPDKVRTLVPVPKERIQEALAAGDEHLNTIPLFAWDVAAGRIRNQWYSQDYTMYRESKLGPWPKGLSLAERVCILKEAARVWAQGA